MADKFIFGLLLIVCVGMSVAMIINALTCDDDPHGRWE
jgi:hypothetical protein